MSNTEIVQVDIEVTVYDTNGQPLPDHAYTTNSSYGEIDVYLKAPLSSRQAITHPSASISILHRLKEMLQQNSTDIFQQIEKLENELELEHLRPRD